MSQRPSASTRNWKVAHQVRRRAGEGGASPSRADAPNDQHNSSALFSTRSGSHHATVIPDQGASSSLFASDDKGGGKRVNNRHHGNDATAFLREEDGLTDIIEHAFDHSRNNKLPPSKQQQSAAHYHQHQHQHQHQQQQQSQQHGGLQSRGSTLRSRTGSFSSLNSSTGSINLLGADDSDLDELRDEEENDGKDRTYMNPFLNSAYSQSSGSSYTTSMNDLSHLRIHSSRSKEFVSTSAFGSPKAVRLMSLLGIVSILLFSLHTAMRDLKRYGQKHRLGQEFNSRHDGAYDANHLGTANTGRVSKWQQMKHKLLKQRQAKTSSVVNSGPHVGMELPPAYRSLQDSETPFSTETATPIFWHIPRAGGATVRELITQCYNYTMASGLGKVPQDLTIDTLKVLHVPVAGSAADKGDLKAKYINVDVYTEEGIAKAHDLGLVPSGMVDVISTRIIHQAALALFDPDHQGKLFTIFRHPVHRASSTFHYVQDTVWRRNHNDLADITIEEYFKSGSGENNWVTRFLTGAIGRQLTNEDLNRAKEILRQKCLIGLLEQKAESFHRFQEYFGWKVNSKDQEQCAEKLVQWAWPLKHSHDSVIEGSDLWNLILTQNE